MTKLPLPGQIAAAHLELRERATQMVEAQPKKMWRNSKGEPRYIDTVYIGHPLDAFISLSRNVLYYNRPLTSTQCGQLRKLWDRWERLKNKQAKI